MMDSRKEIKESDLSGGKFVKDYGKILSEIRLFNEQGQFAKI